MKIYNYFIDDIKKLSESEGFERFGIIKSTRNREVDNEIDEIVLPEGYETLDRTR